MALLQAVPNILNVLLIAILIFVVFGIIGVNFLKGLFYYCDSSGLSSLPGSGSFPMLTKWDCLNSGAEWMKYDSNYDEIFSALRSILFVS